MAYELGVRTRRNPTLRSRLTGSLLSRWAARTHWA